MRTLLALALLALAGVDARAADQWPYEAQCRRFANIAIPQHDIGTAPAGCDSNVLYYGADGGGQGADFAAARACAYRERAAKDDGQFSGAMILTMIYGNGLGVPRNIPLAKRFACDIEGAPAEMDGRLEHLDAIAKDGPGKRRYDICDDVTSGYMEGFCASHDAEFAAVKRRARLDAAMASWTSPQKQAYAGLRKAADAYFAASAEGETDLTGTARGALETQASEDLETSFAASIESFEHGKSPTPGAAALHVEDTRLNATYKAWMNRLAADAKQGESMAGSVTSDGVREAQRKWLAYREAWVAFGASRYPAMAADTWRAWLTHERTALLKSESDDGN